MIRASVLILTLALAAPAFAGQPVTLKMDTAAAGPITLGDLFDGAGAAGKTIIGPSALPGSSVVLDAGQVQRAARANGLDWDNAQGVRRIVIKGLDRADAPAPVPAPAAAVPPRAAAAPARVSAPAAATAARPGPTVQVLTYVRNLNTGDIVRADDITWGEVPSFQAPVDQPRDADAVIGKAAKKPVRAGAAVAARDLAMPQVIKRDDLVHVTYATDGITLSLDAKALGPAALGESVELKNPASKKTIVAVAVGPGRAVVGPEADRIRAAAAPSSLALR